MSKFCTQCGTENIDEAKFCKSCGYSLSRQDTPTGEVSNTTTHIQEFKHQENFSHTEPIGSSEHEQSISDETIAWSPWLLLLPIIVWVIFYLGLEAHTNVPVMIGMIFSASLAEALGGAIGIMGLALIPTVIIWIKKQINGKPYPNFIMHTIIGSVLTLTLGIYSHARSFNNEQQAITASAEVATPATEQNITAEAAAPVEPAFMASSAVVGLDSSSLLNEANASAMDDYEARGPNKKLKEQFHFNTNSSELSDQEYFAIRNINTEYKLIDNELSKTFSKVRKTLSREEKKILKQDEINWIQKRNQIAFSSGEKGSEQYIQSLIESTKERILILEQYNQ